MITAEHVRRLLAADDPDTTLMVVEGEARIVPGPPDAARGLVVAAREDLIREFGDPPDDTEIERIALAFDSSVTELGG